MKTLANQDYVFAKQLKKLRDLVGEVDYAITDSPLLLSQLYNKDQSDLIFKSYIQARYDGFINILVWVNRPEKYQTEGRLHNKEQAKRIDEALIKFVKPDLFIDATPNAHVDLLKLLKERGFVQ